jgi:hypothetical protein
MVQNQSNQKYSLNKTQLDLLELIGTIRFVTVPLLSQWRHKNTSTIHERLSVLIRNEYIIKRYENRWKLLGKPAVYSLSSKGISALRRTRDPFSEQVYKNQYKNKSVSLQHIDHELNIFKIIIQLRNQYGSYLQFSSKAQIANNDDIIRPLPDIYIRRETSGTENFVDYLFEIIEAGTFSWMIRKRIIAHEDWMDEIGEEETYPILLLLCDNDNTEKRIHQITDGDGYGFDTYTSTIERFKSNEKKIWMHYNEEDEELIQL